MSRDPIRFDGGDNLYAYVSGNPVRWVDPEGTRDTWFAPGYLYNNSPDEFAVIVDMDHKTVEVVPPGGESSGTFTDWDFVNTRSEGWIKMGAYGTEIDEDNQCYPGLGGSKTPKPGDVEQARGYVKDYLIDLLKKEHIIIQNAN